MLETLGEKAIFIYLIILSIITLVGYISLSYDKNSSHDSSCRNIYEWAITNSIVWTYVELTSFLCYIHYSNMKNKIQEVKSNREQYVNLRIKTINETKVEQELYERELEGPVGLLMTNVVFILGLSIWPYIILSNLTTECVNTYREKYTTVYYYLILAVVMNSIAWLMSFIVICISLNQANKQINNNATFHNNYNSNIRRVSPEQIQNVQYYNDNIRRVSPEQIQPVRRIESYNWENLNLMLDNLNRNRMQHNIQEDREHLVINMLENLENTEKENKNKVKENKVKVKVKVKIEKPLMLNLSKTNDKIMCVVCELRQPNIIAIPCGHLGTCNMCKNNWISTNNNKCLICRQHIEKYQNIFL
jgi:hypothetical protein